MSYRLKEDEFLPFAPEDAGQVRVNHTNGHCSGASKSMQIERKENGNVIAYCHRCGKLGRFDNPHHKRGEFGGEVPRTKSDDGVGSHSSDGKPSSKSAYIGGTNVFADWPRHTREWLEQYGLGRREVEEHGLVYHSGSDMLVFPCLSGTGTITGYSGRNFKSYGSRWYTDSEHGHPLLHLDDPMCNTVVVVEDPVSAIKVKESGFNSLCIFGVHAHGEHLNILKKYVKVVIWLDDDNSTVRKQQNVLRNKLELLVENVSVIHTNGKDPKAHTTAEIRRILC